MKICAAQVKPITANLEANIKKQLTFVEQAIQRGANLIFFPELSLTGYEPRLAEKLALNQDDEQLNEFQNLSDAQNMIIAVSAPTRSTTGVRISLLIFRPGLPRAIYSKQHLHSDEAPFFESGHEPFLLDCGNQRLAFAICYESLLMPHAQQAHEDGATVYLASVAKAANGIAKAYLHYPRIAQQFGMQVIMANSIGPSDDFVGAGSSAAWNERGECTQKLSAVEERLLFVEIG